jgi:alpha-mannosidase
MVGNAHIDPVWLWRWPSGVVEALSTCRTAADILEEQSDVVFTQSDAWLHEQIETLDPVLFERIKNLIKREQWKIVGGWYIQPDCNLPTAESFRRHMRMGQAYFRSRFNLETDVGYNVDSFGHGAMLPSLLHEFGYDSYVMMRPNPSEKQLPGNLFRWQSPDGKEVLTWRIIPSYSTKTVGDLKEQVDKAIAGGNPVIPHVMCFYGVGDHGGGPTGEQLQWIRENSNSFTDAELIFSHPRQFFDAVKSYRDTLPVVKDELQFHSIGCYSVVRKVKTGIRKAEHELLCAENCITTYDRPDSASSREALAREALARESLESAWKKVLFNQFHDTYGGTCIRQAYTDAENQLGFASTTANSIIYDTLIRHLVELPGSEHQRLVVFNLSDEFFSGCLEHEPWLQGQPFVGMLLNEEGREVPYQIVRQPALVREKKMLIFEEELEPLSRKIYTLRPEQSDGEFASDFDDVPTYLAAEPGIIKNANWTITPGRTAGQTSSLLRISNADGELLSPEGLQIRVLNDRSDTWSHGLKQFPEDPAGQFILKEASLEEDGPVRVSLRIEGEYGSSRLTLWARLYAQSSDIELQLYINWNESFKLAKLVLPFAASYDQRLDGIPGGQIRRPQDGSECPIVDWTLTDKGIGIASPHCFSLDGRESAVRFTLLRSPIYAWHHPAQPDPESLYFHTDQGEHWFTFRIQCPSSRERLRAAALSIHRRPICLDWTGGMV